MDDKQDCHRQPPARTFRPIGEAEAKPVDARLERLLLILRQQRQEAGAHRRRA